MGADKAPKRAIGNVSRLACSRIPERGKAVNRGKTLLAGTRPQASEEQRYTSWDRARLSVVVPVGVIVAVAIVCIVVAVLSSAQRADDTSVEQERQVLTRALNNKASRVLRQVASVATSEMAARNIRAQFDSGWVHQRIGLWLQNFFEHDYVAVLDGENRLVYSAFEQHAANPARFEAARSDVEPLVRICAVRMRSSRARLKSKSRLCRTAPARKPR